MRAILHSDMNAFYASVEQMLDPSLRGKAIAVCGSTETRHGIVLAKSELAKRSGVKTGMANWEARQCCPGLIIVPPQYEQYVRFSALAHEIRWDSTAIDRMLANEKYMGDALSQKTFIADVLEKKPQKNTGQLPQYYVTDNHEAIIPREMFKRVQFERARRGSLEPKGTKTKTNAGRFRPQYVLTEILLCGECGEHYRRCTWARNGKKKVVWRCINRLENGKRNCRESPTLDEGVLHDAILGFLRNLQSPRDELVQNLLEYTEESLEQKTGDSKKQKLLDMLEQKNRLLQEMLSLDIVPDEKIEQLSREYDEIQEQIDSLGDVQNGMEQENAYIRGIKEYMETADFNRYEFDDKLIRQVIEQVIVKNADTLYIRMKGGYEAEIKLPNV